MTTTTKYGDMTYIDPTGRVISIATVHVTPDMARQFLEKNHQLNRTKDKLRINQRITDLQTDSFLFTGDSIKFDEHGFMIDGQTRAEAIAQSGIGADILVVRGLKAEVITVLDQGKQRTVSQIIAMTGLDIKNARECATILGLVMTGSEERQQVSNRPYLASRVMEDHEYLNNWVMWAKAMINVAPIYIDSKNQWGRNSLKSAVALSRLAALGMIFHEQGADTSPGGLVDQFMGAIMTGVAPDPRTATMAISTRRWISTTAALTTDGGKGRYPIMFRNFDTIIRVYNRWVNGDTIRMVSPHGKNEPLHSISAIAQASNRTATGEAPLYPPLQAATQEV